MISLEAWRHSRLLLPRLTRVKRLRKTVEVSSFYRSTNGAHVILVKTEVMNRRQLRPQYLVTLIKVG